LAGSGLKSYFRNS